MVDQVVPADDLHPTAKRLADRIAQNEPRAVAATKRIIYDIVGSPNAVD